MSKWIVSPLFFFLGIFLFAGFSAGQGFSIATFAGSGIAGYSGDGGPASAAQLNLPQSVAVDAAGNVYIADWFNNVVREVTLNGTINTIAGNGSQGYSGDGGPATAAQLSNPTGLAIDPSGNLYIADSANNVIREVTTDGNINTIAGNNTVGYSGDGGPATSAQLWGPYSVALDAAGDLYISDSNNQVIREVLVGGMMVTFGGNHYPGYSGDGGYVAGAQFNYPKGLAMDAAGNLYIADFGNSAVRKVAPNGTITTVAGTGAVGYSGDEGDAATAELAYPESVALDSSGNLYIADTVNQVIREVSPGGTIATVAGDGIPGYAGDGGAALNAQFFFPKGVAVASSGDVYVADWDNNVVRRMTPVVQSGDRQLRPSDR